MAQTRVRTHNKMRELFAYLEAHPDIKEKVMRGGKQANMRTLYIKMAALGIHWREKDQVWRPNKWKGHRKIKPEVAVSSNGHKPEKEVMQQAQQIADFLNKHVEEQEATTAVKLNDNIVLVRVSAHKSKINDAVARLVELAEAENLEVKKVTREQADADGGNWRHVRIRMEMHS